MNITRLGNYKALYIKLVFIILIFAVISSCSLINIKRDSGSKIRIVDINGNYKPLRLYRPALNSKILANQKAKKEQEAKLLSQQKNVTINSETAKSTKMLSNNNIVKSGDVEDNSLIEKGIKDQQLAKVEYGMSSQTSGSDAANQNKKSEVAIVEKPIKSAKRVKNSKVVKSSFKSTFIQIGSYSSLGNAKTSLFKSKKISKGKVQVVNVGSNKIYRVLLGPVNNKKKAKDLLKKAISLGYRDAFITKK